MKIIIWIIGAIKARLKTSNKTVISRQPNRNNKNEDLHLYAASLHDVGDHGSPYLPILCIFK